ncbi:MAG: DUF4129 domain-containing protein [Candidatus Bipolaricaulota bacterium]|nr:DUF4129 domain-containing protein [Candidatus Bipolaricaulota bacterium]
MLSERGGVWLAFACLVSLVVLSVLLSASLDTVTFTEGSPFDEHNHERSPLGMTLAPSPMVPLQWIDYLMAYGPPGVLIIGLLVYVAARRTGWTQRKTSLTGTLALALIMVALAIVAREQIVRTLGEDPVLTEETAEQAAEPPGEAAPPLSEPAEGPTTSVAEGRASSSMLQIALAIVTLGAAAGLFVAALRRRARAPRRASASPDLMTPVGAALEELRFGRDAVGIVERCYREMMKSYAEASGIDATALTPREFARALAATGLGGAALDELTSLFELVRYGRRPDDGFSPRALRCMVQLRDSLVTTSALDS